MIHVCEVESGKHVRRMRPLLTLCRRARFALVSVLDVFFPLVGFVMLGLHLHLLPLRRPDLPLRTHKRSHCMGSYITNDLRKVVGRK